MIFHLISFLFYFTTSEVSDVPHRKSSSQIATKTPSVVTVSPATRRDREGGRRQKTIPGLSKTLFATFHTAAVPPLRLLCFFFLSNYSIMSSSTILQSYTPVSGETLFPLLPRWCKSFSIKKLKKKRVSQLLCTKTTTSSSSSSSLYLYPPAFTFTTHLGFEDLLRRCIGWLRNDQTGILATTGIRYGTSQK